MGRRNRNRRLKAKAEDLPPWLMQQSIQLVTTSACLDVPPDQLRLRCARRAASSSPTAPSTTGATGNSLGTVGEGDGGHQPQPSSSTSSLPTTDCSRPPRHASPTSGRSSSTPSQHPPQPELALTPQQQAVFQSAILRQMRRRRNLGPLNQEQLDQFSLSQKLPATSHALP